MIPPNEEFTLLVFLFVSIAITWIAYSRGYYRLPYAKAFENSPYKRGQLRSMHVFIAFGLFFFAQLILLPFVEELWQVIVKETANNKESFYMEFLGALLSFFLLGCYFLGLSPACRTQIIGPKIYCKTSQKFVDVLIGSATWLIAYPWVLVVGQFLGIVLLFFNVEPSEQVAVQRVQQVISDPKAMILTSFAVIMIIPVIEELLFRGFLQTYLKGLLGVTKSIIITSIVFSLFHFSVSQGMNNLRIIGSLFVLSCYLGFIRERQCSLLSSIALHGTFNGVSILMMI